MTHDDETNALVAAAYEDALAICRECGLAGDHPNDALTILLRGQAPSDAQAALDRIIQRAKNEALEKAANRMKAAAHDALSIDYRDAFCLAEGIIRAMKEPEE